ncbi:histidine kinase 3-like [Cucurbita pepo subsp. pepo]|uniref:histidine kinase 3-like n=1 Tax=Cucurbita pepo subsp. pepo TaxID=3664 RepID=UPI000C9D2F55|nr:histidine kinase 3-like [Cucurbita pepo subsp. pepo]
MNWFIYEVMEAKGGLVWVQFWEKLIGKCCKMHHQYYQYIGSKKARNTWWRRVLVAWVLCSVFGSLWIFHYMSSQATEKRKEGLGSMCDERARMLQDQFNVSMNHIQAMSILISTFHHAKNPSAIDQRTFARYTERTAFERPLTSGVAYAVRVLHSERERFEKQQGWTIKRMDKIEQSPVHEDDYAPEDLEPSPTQDEYAPVIFAQDTISHVVSLDMLSGKEDRKNVLRARASGKGVLTAPFKLIKTNRLGVILTFAVYKRDLPSNATPNERIQATDGYLGGVFDIESLVEKLLQQLASNQTILVNVYDTTNQSHPISMYGKDVSEDGLQHVSPLNFGDPDRKHEMRCRFKQKQPWPWLAISTSIGILIIALLLGYIFHATLNRITKVEDDYHEMMELKKRAEAADVAKSQFLATVSHEIRSPMNGVLGMLDLLMDTGLDFTQQDFVRSVQDSGKALVSLVNEVLDQAKIESGKLELEAIPFNLQAILDDILSLFSGKSQEKGLELAVYISDSVPEMLVGDPGRFRQIITNLVGNSIKFTEQGHIFITVNVVEEVLESIDLEIESSTNSTLSGYPVANRRLSWAGFQTLSQDGPTACHFPPLSPDHINLMVSVEDTGVGIPLEAQSRVFTPFMQVRPSTSRTHGGTGIGLSISKCLVGLMKGEIGFASVPTIGSTFTFTAVFSNEPSEYDKSQQIKNTSISPSSAFKGMRALVVDHRPIRAKVSRYHIQRLGINVELLPDLNQCVHTTMIGGSAINMIFVEQDLWDKDMSISDVLIHNLRNSNGVPPKLFLLTNSSDIISDVLTPILILKPLRAGMLAASLHRFMGVGINRNGELPVHSLRHLLLGRKILIIDDNKVNRIVAAGALKRYGADVVCKNSGIDAIRLLTPPHRFDACFMDIQMPEMDGFEATRRIREIECRINDSIEVGEQSKEAYENKCNWHVPIFAMTADVIQATHEKCLRCGMDGYVTKPFEIDRLYREVSQFFHSTSNGSL